MIEVLGVQLIGIIFGLIFIYLTFLNKKRNELTDSEALFWMFIWGGLIIVSIFAQSIFGNFLNILVKDILKMARILDFFIIIAFLIIFGILFYMFVITKRTQNRVEKLVRNIALEKASKHKKK